jgi:hypothetical protein
MDPPVESRRDGLERKIHIVQGFRMSYEQVTVGGDVMGYFAQNPLLCLPVEIDDDIAAEGSIGALLRCRNRRP